MKAHPIENQNAINDKETLEALVNFMGALDGGVNNPEFKATKKEIMESGISSEQLWELMTSNAAEEILGREIIDVKVQKLTETAIIPTYSHTTDACADIYADEDAIILPGCTAAISTGIALAIPDGFVVHVYARSGLSLKTNLRLANSVGIIDAGYRDELKILCWNAGTEPITIEKGMRIAQMDIMQSPAIEFHEVKNVKDFGEDRMGGFGSSGLFASDLNG